MAWRRAYRALPGRIVLARNSKNSAEITGSIWVWHNPRWPYKRNFGHFFYILPQIIVTNRNFFFEKYAFIEFYTENCIWNIIRIWILVTIFFCTVFRHRITVCNLVLNNYHLFPRLPFSSSFFLISLIVFYFDLYFCFLLF